MAYRVRTKQNSVLAYYNDFFFLYLINDVESVWVYDLENKMQYLLFHSIGLNGVIILFFHNYYDPVPRLKYDEFFFFGRENLYIKIVN